ncbi:hypothetical protein ACFQ0B_43340 [Nonomuraea thailandensis]
MRPAGTGWRTCPGLPGQEVLYAVRLASATGEAAEGRIAAAYQAWSSGSGGGDSPSTTCRASPAGSACPHRPPARTSCPSWWPRAC